MQIRLQDLDQDKERAVTPWLSTLNSIDRDRRVIEAALLSIAECRRVLEDADRALDWRGLMERSLGRVSSQEGGHAFEPADPASP